MSLDAGSRLTLVIASGVAMAVAGTIVFARSCARIDEGRPVAASGREVAGGAKELVLDDIVPGDEGPDIERVTRVHARTGAVIDRDETSLDGGLHSEREQFCDTVNVSRSTQGAPTLRLPAYSGQFDYQDGAENPENTLTIDKKVGPLGFLVRPGTKELVTVGDDVFLVHMARYDGSGEHEDVQSWITRLDHHAHAVWTLQLAGGCQYALLDGELLVVAMKDPAHRAMALDLATGVPRWQLAR